MISLRYVPLSGDELADWVFKQFIFFLRKDSTHIKRKKRLTGTWGKKTATARGTADANPKIEISINSAKCHHPTRDDEVGTLIHELSHVVFWKTPEKFILQMEKILIEKFTREQKNLLKSFIPRHEVKK